MVGFEHRVVQVSRILPDLLALEGVVEQLLDERAVRYTLVDLHGSFLAEVRKVERRSVKIGIKEPQYHGKGVPCLEIILVASVIFPRTNPERTFEEDVMAILNGLAAKASGAPVEVKPLAKFPDRGRAQTRHDAQYDRELTVTRLTTYKH